jgi:hypothetical protein
MAVIGSRRFFNQPADRLRTAIDRDLDIVDGLAEGDIQQQGGATARRALNQQGGIPTGIAPDIATQISTRNKEAAKKHEPERSR